MIFAPESRLETTDRDGLQRKLLQLVNSITHFSRSGSLKAKSGRDPFSSFHGATFESAHLGEKIDPAGSKFSHWSQYMQPNPATMYGRFSRIAAVA